MGKSSDGMNEYRMGNGHGINPELHEDFRSSSEIRRDIERTRADMDETVREIRRKLSPQQISEYAFDTFQDVFRKNGPKILDSIRSNPMPIAIVGSGIGWMLYELLRGPRERHREFDESMLYTATGEPYYAGEGYMAGEFFGEGEFIGTEGGYQPGFWSKARRRASRMRSKGKGAIRGAAHTLSEKAGDVAHNISERAGGMAHNISEKADHMAHGFTDRAGDVAHGVTEKASHLAQGIGRGAGAVAHGFTGAISTAGGATGHAIKVAGGATGHAIKVAGGATGHAIKTASVSVGHQATRAGHAVQRGYDRNPILMGALAMIGTAALAMSLPPTKPEDELMGEQSDRLLNKARSRADRALGKAMDRGGEALHNVAESATEKIRQGRQKLESAREGESAQGMQGSTGQPTTDWPGQNVHGASPTAPGSDFESGEANQDDEGRHGGTSYHAGY